ncbi:MAG: alpha/beta fold hydrolase [Dehalococcoidia bacterium]
MKTLSARVGDVDLCFDDWGGSGRPVLFLHATGFSRGCWRPMASELAERCRPILVDLRGHGGSTALDRPYVWAQLADDVGGLISGQGWKDVVLVGHSVGGATAVEVAGRLGAPVSALVLAEPVLMERPRTETTLEAVTPTSPLVERTRQRRAVWPTQEEAKAYLRGRPPYSLWAEPVRESWLETAFLPKEGEWVLSCPPFVEASIFELTGGSRAMDYLPELACPTWLIRATGSLGMRTTCAPSVAGSIRNCDEFVVPGSGHFLPLQYPEFVVSLVNMALDHLESGASDKPAS